MFDRFIRLARARKALRERRFEDALLLAADPLIRSDRRAEAMRLGACDQLVARARRKLAESDHAGARADLARAAGTCPCGAVEAFRAELDAAVTAGQASLDHARGQIAASRRLLAQADLDGAARALDAIVGEHCQAERREVMQRIEEVRRAAEEQYARLDDRLAREPIANTLAWWRQSHVPPPVQAAHCAAFERFLDAVAVHAAAEIDSHVRASALADAARRYRAAWIELPGLRDRDAMRRAAAALQEAVLAGLRDARDLDEAMQRATVALDTGIGDLGPDAAAAVDGLRRAEAARARGDVAAAAAALRAVAASLGARRLAQAADALAAHAASMHERLGAARAAIACGDLDRARPMLMTLLAEDPMLEPARRELDLVDQGLSDRAQRLSAARTAAREGRLREACAQALALVGSGRTGEEAQQVVTEVRARIALVDRGLDEVRVALHGRTASSLEGVRHCLRRVEELAKVQTDHEELPRLRAAIEAEIEALGAIDRAAAMLAAGEAVQAAGAFRGLMAGRDKLLSPDRLDARLLALGDGIAEAAERALALGDLAVADACAAQVEATALGVEFGRRLERLRCAGEARRQAAAALLLRATEAANQHEIDAAESLLDQARAQWNACPAVRSLAERVARLRQQDAALAQVEAMAGERDFRGANERLASMPPTPAMLRTRIFDIKQSLARAQGLEGTFLLRVDEGGEHLVLRGESIAIGNVRQARVDLPVLANVAGRHARIQRSMSFHGGMEDTVIAEEGEVRVANERTASHRLAPGDRIHLGPSLAMTYQRPSSRSLTVGLQLLGGFQVAGTDRILLMKDRGRDGRVLIGAAKDAHIRVAGAEGEVEVFANRAGQMRVLCDAGGTIDGKPFRGEHPVAAGEVVAAAGVSFVLLPWQP